MKFKTETGSTYEVDETAKRIRRQSGTKPGTLRQAPDGQWQPYQELLIAKGANAIIVWPDGTPLLAGSPANSIPMTTTGIVTEICDDV